MGDIIHTLPAVTDAARSKSGLRFDWVVEEAFTEIPAWHPAVERVIPVAIRRWRKQLFRTIRNREISQFRKELKSVHYDLVIDAQGLIKSGLVSRMARGLTVGLSNSTIREPLATLFYNKKFSVATDLHAVQRVRELFARTLNYRFDPSEIDYGIGSTLRRPATATATEEEPLRRPRIMLLHGTTWPNKHWPRAYWMDLAARAVDHGYDVMLPWGDIEERERAIAIAGVRPEVTVLPAMSLTELAQELSRVTAAVAVDTGLAHLAAALNVPCITLYGPTNPALSGTWGRHQMQLQSSLDCAPCMKRRCEYTGAPVADMAAGRKVLVVPPCFSSHPPASVFEQLKAMIAGAV